MKKITIFTLTALTIMGCSQDFCDAPVVNDDCIVFKSAAPNMSRAVTGGDAASKLGNQFVVWGEKDADTNGSAAAEGKLAFKNYKVEYTAGTANTTESNTANWEYVGLIPYTETQVAPALNATQSIKYWDYGAANYVFNAFSALQSDLTDGNVIVTKTESATGAEATKYDKGYSVKINATASLEDIYFSDRLVVTRPGSTTTVGTTHNTYGNQVDLTFRAAAAKIRFAVFETVPGYSIQITKAYYTETSSNSEASSTTNFAIDGGFIKIGDTPATMNVTYYKDTESSSSGVSIENQPKVTITGGDALKSMIFGTANVGAEVLGTTSPTATFDQTDKAYTVILPNINNDKPMSLKLDYKLTSIDGSKEEINVSHATAVVPAAYCNWKSNFAYTYLFKISDNTNGSTGTPGTDPAGLYPITFDAVVAVAEDGYNQETITNVTDESITTYAQGINATVNSDYAAGDIYFTNVAKDVTNFRVYEVNNLDPDQREAITEEVVANWQNNFITLREITPTHIAEATNIPLEDGTYIPTAANQAGYFTAEANTTYVIATNDPAAAGTRYKVIRVGASPVKMTYASTLSATKLEHSANQITYTVTADGNPVMGTHVKIFLGDVDKSYLFTITEDTTTKGKYTIQINPETIDHHITSETYTIKTIGAPDADKSLTVDLTTTVTDHDGVYVDSWKSGWE